MPKLVKLLGFFLLILGSPSLSAQGSELGKREFMNSCAQCHGASGTRNGSIVEFLNSKPPVLTTLQKNNDGIFPVARLFEVIHGSNTPGAHGTREMPAWGERYDTKTLTQLGEMYSPSDQEAFVRGRILALTEYVSTLQVP